LTNAATAGDTITTISFYVSSVLNAIPATAGSVSDSNIVSMAGSKLTGTQTVPKATLPTGCILQVVNASYSTTTFNSTSTYADTGLTAAITPTSATSKILVIVNQADPFKAVGNASSAINIKLVRNSTDLITFGLANCYTGTSSQLNGTSIGTTYLDSPATTSATTYKTQFANYTNAAQVGVQATGAASTITLMEIAG
jgi:hypothetical protein